jgi:hypothetical protein
MFVEWRWRRLRGAVGRGNCEKQQQQEQRLSTISSASPGIEDRTLPDQLPSLAEVHSRDCGRFEASKLPINGDEDQNGRAGQ